MNLEREIAHDLLSIGAVFLRPDEPFTWASGIKSPIYCDNRLILTAPEARNEPLRDTRKIFRRVPTPPSVYGPPFAGTLRIQRQGVPAISGIAARATRRIHPGHTRPTGHRPGRSSRERMPPHSASDGRIPRPRRPWSSRRKKPYRRSAARRATDRRPPRPATAGRKTETPRRRRP